MKQSEPAPALGLHSALGLHLSSHDISYVEIKRKIALKRCKMSDYSDKVSSAAAGTLKINEMLKFRIKNYFQAHRCFWTVFQPQSKLKAFMLKIKLME